MNSSPVSQTEKEIESFLREQEESFDYDSSNDNCGGTPMANRKRFSSDDDDAALTEDIRKMARALAPQISELEDVLKDFTDAESADALDRMKQPEINNVSHSIMDEEDDDLDDEMAQLAMSEQALREEMDIISMLGSPIPGFDDGEEIQKNQTGIDLPSPVDLNTRLAEEDHGLPTSLLSNSEGSGVIKLSEYSLQDHADFLKLKTERTGRWYYCDMTSKLMPTALSEAPSDSIHVTEDFIKDYCLPVPFRKLKRIYGGLIFHDVWQDKRQKVSNQGRPPPCTSATKPISTPSVGTTPKSNDVLQTPATTQSMSTPGTAKTTGGFTMKVSITPGTVKAPTPGAASEQKPPRTPLKQIKTSTFHSNKKLEEPLPVRTLAIRVRPDVLCGAIMDAAHHAFEVLPSNCTKHIMKRQGAHLRGAVYLPHKQLAYIADVQVCTQKNDNLDRRLLLRFYHIQDDPEALQELGQILQREMQKRNDREPPPPQPHSETISASTISSTGEEENIDVANRHMKQSCSLIQRLMAEQQTGEISRTDLSWLGLKDKSFDSKSIMQYAIGSHLESTFQSCPSVREENKKAEGTIRRLTLPSLSKRDWPMLEASWSLTNRIVEELDTRDCSYNTLATLPFGQFPSLPTLDVQYCSQLRRLSRENMITYLLKAAKELEEYAGLAEYNCALLITLLEPMMKYYGLPAISLPQAKALDEYPLDFTPPQVTCPPWGGLVSDALNRVAAKTPTGDINEEDAVRLVYGAFMRQDDEEQAARLGRKNAQIMDRLANMQSHQRALVQTLSDAHQASEKAESLAAQFLKYSQQALNKGKEGYPANVRKGVPVLDIKISLGASRSGRCYVTSKQIVFVTSYLPLVGSTRSVALDLNLIDFRVVPNPISSLMNPFPNTMDVILKSSNDKVFSFRPAMGPHRLQTFLTILQSFASENSGPSEFSQVLESSDETQILKSGEAQLGDEDGDVTV